MELTLLCWSMILSATAIVSRGEVSSQSPTFRGLFLREPRHRLSSVASKQLRNSSIEHCASGCVRETSFQCKSFDFDNRGRICMLFSVNLDDLDVHLIPAPDRDHYKTNYAKLYNRLPNHMLTKTHNRRIDYIGVEECARRCTLETVFKCRGFDYETASRTCWLTERTSTVTGGVTVQEGWDYYRRQPEGPLSRFVSYGYGRLKTLTGVHVYQKVVMGVNLETCATMCLANTNQQFHCLSFDYVFDGSDRSTCHMSKYIAPNVYGLAMSQQSVMHFEKKEEYLNYFYVTPYVVVLGNNLKSYTHVTPNRCARMCMYEESFVCRSFDYTVDGGECSLSSKTGSDVGGLYKQGLAEIHHFEMKPILDCGGNLTKTKGNLASPNWPRNYASNEQCNWHIVVPRHKVIHLVFTHLDLGLKYHDPCSEREDRVTVTDMTALGPRHTCIQPNTKKYVSRSHEVRVSFTSNEDIDGQGFRAFYTAEWTCDVHLSSAPGEFASPFWPDKYPPSTRCSWRITAPKGHRVRLNITEFQLEHHTLGHCNEQFDHLVILDGGTINSPRIGLYCGTHQAFTLRSSGRDLFVQFRTDEDTARPGFHATYQFETLNGTLDGAGKSDEDLIVGLGEESEDGGRDGTKYLEGDDDSKGSGPKVQGDPSAEKHQQTEDDENVANDKEFQVGGSQSADGEYRSTLWAVLTTLLVILIVLAVVLFLVWRHYKGQLTRQRQMVTEETPAEEVPLQEPCCSKPNNELDLAGASASHNATQFTNLLYGDTEKKVNIKNINLDTKG